MSRECTIFPVVANRSPWIRLFLLLGLVALGACLGQLIASMLYPAITDDVTATSPPALPPKQALLVLQATTASGAFILAPLLYLHIFTPRGIGELFRWRQPYTAPTLTTLGLVLSFMVVNAWFIQWNMTIRLPAWLSAFEIWAQEKEATLQRITVRITSFRSLKELGIAIGVIGLIPAVGEELLFRGLVQPIFYQRTKNIHLAIGMSAFAFSAIHLQFYGLVPRFLLGMLFGYIYWWTKDLFFPIVAHFSHNTCTLLMLFLHQHGVMTQDPFTVQAPPGPVLALFATLVVILSNRLQQQGKRVAHG